MVSRLPLAQRETAACDAHTQCQFGAGIRPENLAREAGQLDLDQCAGLSSIHYSGSMIRKEGGLDVGLIQSPALVDFQRLENSLLALC